MHFLPADLRENTHMQTIIFPMRVFGALIYSDQPFKHVIFLVYVFYTCNMATACAMQIYALQPKYWSSIDNIAASIATTMAYISCNFQNIRLFFAHKDLVDIVTYMIRDSRRLFFSKDAQVTKMYKDYTFITKCVFIIMFGAPLTTAILILFTTVQALFNNAQIYETDHFLDAENMPFLLLMYPYRSFTRNFFVAYIYPFIAIYVGALFMIGWLVMWSTLLLYPVFVFKFIKFKLENLDNIPPSLLNAEIISLIKLHIQTKNFIRKMESFMSRFVFVDFLLFSVLMCFLLFQLSESSEKSMNGPILFLYFVSVSFMQLVYHAIATEILYQGSTLSTSFYLSSWYKFPVKVQKMGLMMMIGFTDPVQMQAVFIDMNLSTFLRIIRAAYGYFTMLRNINHT